MAARRSRVEWTLVGRWLASTSRRTSSATRSRYCWLMSIRANSTSASSGTDRISWMSLREKVTLPAPMTATLIGIGILLGEISRAIGGRDPLSVTGAVYTQKGKNALEEV